MAALPSGAILLWFGSIATIPAGYVLCNGANGTPDLRNRFLVGAGDTYAVGDNGGAVNHNHDFTTNGHNHQLLGGTVVQGGVPLGDTTSTDTDTGTTDNANSLPPYYALAYIMKT